VGRHECGLTTIRRQGAVSSAGTSREPSPSGIANQDRRPSKRQSPRAAIAAKAAHEDSSVSADRDGRAACRDTDRPRQSRRP
jgi:hypothetical protein